MIGVAEGLHGLCVYAHGLLDSSGGCTVPMGSNIANVSWLGVTEEFLTYFLSNPLCKLARPS